MCAYAPTRSFPFFQKSIKKQKGKRDYPNGCHASHHPHSRPAANCNY